MEILTDGVALIKFILNPIKDTNYDCDVKANYDGNIPNWVCD
jgi:hypothetical protein